MKQKLFIIFCCVFILYGCTDVVPNSKQGTVTSNEVKSRALGNRTFVFPTIQWENFDNHDQKLVACQVPDSILSQISTEELVEICMEYPLLYDAFAFDTPLKGLEVVVSRSNAFHEIQRYQGS